MVQDIFFSETCRFADVILPAVQASKRKAPSPARSGAFSGSTRCSSRWGKPARLADHPGHRQPAGRELELSASFGDHRGDRVADAAVRRRDLRAAGRLQVAAVAGAADGTDQPLLYTQKIHLPRRQGEAASRLPWTEPTEPARRGVRSASEQRPPARAFPRRQHDLPHRGHPRESARHVRRGLARAGRRARHPKRDLGAARLALWPVRVQALVTDRVQRQGTLHADELIGKPGEPPDQQPHR